MTSGLPVTSGSFCSMSRATATWRPAIPFSVRDFEQTRHAGIRLAVQRMAEPRNGAARVAGFDEGGKRRGARLADGDVAAVSRR